MSIFFNYDNIDDLAIYGREDIKKFIRANYQKYTIYQLSEMLGVTPGFIQETLSLTQIKRAGSRAAATVLILRDIDMWSEDSTKWHELDH